ncbi:hypothetical protein MPTK1_2g17800 [Marchantia polymorpha subsp. ruderalis]|uniref:Uncharacterized protein n=1 Tax=Marchantia polymorpha TaxID=3197 RepID=A0A2R6WGA5_MARPO|nr:hypothetical protein MARPO_0094s0048 [Marchantia polymorpha]BBN02748.1 hypothetical protein Mp_2g17800 [Marchantia polymorpha subsp. ruderalis]|eukprot:PTQ32874.1 hypothetical protein MARPO_0094s0048 [Marchantia polymorpha]
MKLSELGLPRPRQLIPVLSLCLFLPLYSSGPEHDEFDFEFLGEETGQAYLTFWTPTSSSSVSEIGSGVLVCGSIPQATFIPTRFSEITVKLRGSWMTRRSEFTSTSTTF